MVALRDDRAEDGEGWGENDRAEDGAEANELEVESWRGCRGFPSSTMKPCASSISMKRKAWVRRVEQVGSFCDLMHVPLEAVVSTSVGGEFRKIAVRGFDVNPGKKLLGSYVVVVGGGG